MPQRFAAFVFAAVLLCGWPSPRPMIAEELSLSPLRLAPGSRTRVPLRGGRAPYSVRCLRRDLARLHVEGDVLVVEALSAGRSTVLVVDGEGRATQVPIEIGSAPTSAPGLPASPAPSAVARPRRAAVASRDRRSPRRHAPVGAGFHAEVDRESLGPGESCHVQLLNGFPPYRVLEGGRTLPVRGSRHTWTIPPATGLRRPTVAELVFLDVRDQRCTARVTVLPASALRAELEGAFPLERGQNAVLRVTGGIPPYHFSGVEPAVLDVQALTPDRFRLTYGGGAPASPLSLRIHGAGTKGTTKAVPVRPRAVAPAGILGRFHVESPARSVEQYRNLAVVLRNGRAPYRIWSSENLLVMRSGHDDLLLYGLFPGEGRLEVLDSSGARSQVDLSIVPNGSGVRESPSQNLSVSLSDEVLAPKGRVELRILDGRPPYQVRQEGGDGAIDVEALGEGVFRIRGREAGSARIGVRDGRGSWAFRAVTVRDGHRPPRRDMRLVVQGERGFPGSGTEHTVRVEKHFTLEVAGGRPPFVLHDAFARASIRPKGDRSFILRSMLRGKLIRPVITDARGERIAETIFVR